MKQIQSNQPGKDNEEGGVERTSFCPPASRRQLHNHIRRSSRFCSPLTVEFLRHPCASGSLPSHHMLAR